MLKLMLRSLPWRVQSHLKVITDLQEGLGRLEISGHTHRAICVRPAVAEMYPEFPINVRWARCGGGFEPRYAYDLKEAEVALETGLVSIDGWTLAESIGDHLNAGANAFAWKMARPWLMAFGQVERLDDDNHYVALRCDGYFHFVMECLPCLLYSLKQVPESIVLVDGKRYSGFCKGYVDILRERGIVTQVRKISKPVQKWKRL